MEDKKYPSHTLDKFQLRFPEGMRDQVKEASKESGRSMNAEIVHRLEETFINTHPATDAGELMPANKAREISEKVRSELSISARQYAIREINDHISRGKQVCHLSFLSVLGDSEDWDDSRMKTIIAPIIKEIERAGYKIDKGDDPALWTVHI
ncbi:MAG: Arc family DNA-binding protein [Pontibacterium sp.]